MGRDVHDPVHGKRDWRIAMENGYLDDYNPYDYSYEDWKEYQIERQRRRQEEEEYDAEEDS